MTVALFFFRLATAGGAERIICWLAGALAERGFRVHLFSLDEPDASAFFPLHPAVRWDKLGFRPGVLDKLRRTRELSARLRKGGVQVLIGFVMSGDKTVYAAAKIAGVRLIVAERNAPSMYRLRYSNLQRWMTFALLHLADRIAVQLPSFAAGYPKSLRGRIESIPNPVPVAMRLAQPQLANHAGKFTLLTVSRLDGVQKRIDLLIRTFARVAPDHPAWNLLIIGDGPEKDRLHQQIIDSDLTDRVQIKPAMINILDAYTEAHLFAIPSSWEGFSNALAEALSHGLPAVGFAGAAGVADLIGTSGGGWLAEGLDDESSFAKALDQAMTDGGERLQRGESAVWRMADFVPEAQVERWAGLIGSVVSERTQ